VRRQPVEQVGDAEVAGRLGDAGGHVAGRFRAGAQREADVLRDRKVGVERVALEHHRDVPVPRRDVLHRHAVVAHLAAGRRLHAGEQPQERGLAAAGRPEQHHELARRHLQVDIGDRRDAIAEHLRQRPSGNGDHTFMVGFDARR
jgi:hypothetical protein